MIQGFIPPEVGNDEHIIRRLGWAVIRQWANLPEDVKQRIREQAVFTEDRYQTSQLSEQINIFLRKHAGNSDA